MQLWRTVMLAPVYIGWDNSSTSGCLLTLADEKDDSEDLEELHEALVLSRNDKSDSQ